MNSQNLASAAQNWDFLQMTSYFGPRLFFAVVCGGIVGFERELKNKPAGIKTNILICVGSALYTSISVLIAGAYESAGHIGDPGRLAAQIVSGIGFLGGGTIIQARGTILGLTTAATIWVVAAIGLAIGIGHWDIGLASAISVVVILVASNFFEDRILGRSLSFACEIAAQDADGRIRKEIHQALSQNDLVLDDFDAQLRGELSVLTLRYSGHRSDHRKFILGLWGIPGIAEVKQQ